MLEDGHGFVTSDEFAFGIYPQTTKVVDRPGTVFDEDKLICARDALFQHELD